MRVLQSKYPRAVELLAFGPNGLLAAAGGGFVEVWGATGAAPGWNHSSRLGPCHALAFVGPSVLFVGGPGGGELLGLRTIRAHAVVDVTDTGWAFGAFAAAPGRVLVGRTERGVAALTGWALPQVKLLWKLDRWGPHTYFRAGAAVSADGARVAFATNVGSNPTGQFVTVHDTATGARVARFELDPTSAVRQLAFAACGTKLLLRGDDRTVRLVDAATGAPAGELKHPGRSFVTGVAVHPGGTVACARTDGTVTLWNPGAPGAERVLDWKAGRLRSVAFAPDGALGACGTEDGRVIAWDATD